MATEEKGELNKEFSEMRLGDRNVERMFQVQLDKDEGRTQDQAG